MKSPSHLVTMCHNSLGYALQRLIEDLGEDVPALVGVDRLLADDKSPPQKVRQNLLHVQVQCHLHGKALEDCVVLHQLDVVDGQTDLEEERDKNRFPTVGGQQRRTVRSLTNKFMTMMDMMMMKQTKKAKVISG